MLPGLPAPSTGWPLVSQTAALMTFSPTRSGESPVRWPQGSPAVSQLGAAVLRRLLKTLASKPTAGWALRRGQLVHGVASPIDYLLALREYSLKDCAPKITCPVLVCSAEGDDISASAPQLVEALTCEKHYVHFTAAEGAGDHCEAGASAFTTRDHSDGSTTCCGRGCWRGISRLFLRTHRRPSSAAAGRRERQRGRRCRIALRAAW